VHSRERGAESRKQVRKPRPREMQTRKRSRIWKPRQVLQAKPPGSPEKRKKTQNVPTEVVQVKTAENRQRMATQAAESEKRGSRCSIEWQRNPESERTAEAAGRQKSQTVGPTQERGSRTQAVCSRQVREVREQQRPRTAGRQETVWQSRRV